MGHGEGDHWNGSMGNLQNVQTSSNPPICSWKRTIRYTIEVSKEATLGWKNQSLPPSRTGICKNLPSCMICSASRIVVSNVAQSGCAVITWIKIVADTVCLGWIQNSTTFGIENHKSQEETFSTRVNSGERFWATTRISTSFELKFTTIYSLLTSKISKKWEN
jgi:hypothetical protein